MIVRASRPKVSFDTSRSLQSAFEQLSLPWLCPALYTKPNRIYRRQNATVTKKWIDRTRAHPPALCHPPSVQHRSLERKYAYAAAADYPGDDYEDHIPFENLNYHYSQQNPPLHPWAFDRGLSELPSFDPSSPLVLHDSIQPAPRRFRSRGLTVGGDVGTIHQTLEACLKVGRFERAAATLRRLNFIYKPQAPELIEAHNAYLSSLIDRVVNTKDQQLLKQVQRWFEVDIRGQGIPPDPMTYGLMLRATFQEADQLKVDRTIRRYIGLAEQADLRNEALAVALSTLNAQEIGRVTQVCPSTFYPADDLALEIADLETAQTSTEVLEEDEAYHVKAQIQKGLGLTALQKSLSVFSDSSLTTLPGREHLSEERRQAALAYERQKVLEEDTWNAALTRWRSEHEDSLKRMGVHSGLQTKTVGAEMWVWHEALVPLIRKEIESANEAEVKEKPSKTDQIRLSYAPFLQYLSAEKISAITIIQTLNKICTLGVDRGTKVGSLVSTIAHAIQDESIAEGIKGNKTVRTKSTGRMQYSKEIRQNQLARLVKFRQHYHTPKSLASSTPAVLASGESKSLTPDPEWHVDIKGQVGAILVSLLIQAAKIEVNQKDSKTGTVSREIKPVFTLSHYYENGKRYGIVRVNSTMSAKLSREPVKGALSKHLPMLVEPRLWTRYKTGGFLEIGVPVVRGGTKNMQLRNYIVAAAESGDMSRVFAGLDILGKTPWRINESVFKIMLQVWNSGEALAKVPPENPKLEYPPEPTTSATEKERKEHAYRVREIENARDGMHSERCFLNFQLEVARAYLGETFYFPHNVDFRGRAYPIPPYLNHMGADNCRGLLMFGKGKELGETGLRWLKIHLANVFGYDKASFNERHNFASEHVEDIRDSAKDPLGGSRWWLKAEDPWQCLAACMELTKALDSPDPAKFISYLPIHQDGTCNGLQHYAALGGDTIGAKQVNLEPGDRPADIYTAVADAVSREIAHDAQKGDPMAKAIEGLISRKIVKPTVMTNVYGVTFAGARRQVSEQLKDVYPDKFAGPTSDAKYLARVSLYITRKIFTALSEMFNGAHFIQYWLGECAWRICGALTPEQIESIENDVAGRKSETPFHATATNDKIHKDEHYRFKSTVIWTTPLKLPVVQPYRKYKARQIKTNLQLINLNEPSVSDPVDRRKQLQAFPPNFIHSLDATHMMLSALRCNELGLTFAAVHDSFWTHAADIDTMNGIIRDSFIQMHSENIIGRLQAEFAARYKGCMYLARVKGKSPLGEKIKALRKSVKTSSGKLTKQQIDELLMEKRRLALLASEDPKDQAEGHAMVTPGKLFAETSDKNDLMTLEELGDLEAAIGQLPVDPADQEDEIPHEQVQDKLISATSMSRPVNAKSQDPGLPTEEYDADEQKKAKNAARAKLARNRAYVWLWLPLEFPPVPKKGNFEVARLKDSKYFFC